MNCWDGAQTTSVQQCSEPAGTAGLAWVYPSISGQRCGSATNHGPKGLVLRQVCRAQVTGGRAVVVYAQWPSTAAAEAYIRTKGLRPVGGSDGVDLFQSPGSGPTKVGAAYAGEPFSYIITLPRGADPSSDVRAAVTARPADQVRGAPAG